VEILYFFFMTLCK